VTSHTGTSARSARAPQSSGNRTTVYTALWTSKQLGRLDSSGHVVQTWDVPGALQIAASQGALWVTDPFSGSPGTVARVRLDW
jgi:hypothetical protein